MPLGRTVRFGRAVYSPARGRVQASPNWSSCLEPERNPQHSAVAGGMAGEVAIVLGAELHIVLQARQLEAEAEATVHLVHRQFRGEAIHPGRSPGEPHLAFPIIPARDGYACANESIQTIVVAQIEARAGLDSRGRQCGPLRVALDLPVEQSRALLLVAVGV